MKSQNLRSRGKFDPSQDQRAIVASKQLNEPNQAMFNTSQGGYRPFNCNKKNTSFESRKRLRLKRSGLLPFHQSVCCPPGVFLFYLHPSTTKKTRFLQGFSAMRRELVCHRTFQLKSRITCKAAKKHPLKITSWVKSANFQKSNQANHQ